MVKKCIFIAGICFLAMNRKKEPASDNTDDANKPDETEVVEVFCNALPATDALGRKLTEHAVAGDVRSNKYVGIMAYAVDMEFKWNDNMQENGNIMDFYVNGDTAPGGRLNYIYLAEK
jgi:hypothetical protein